MLKALVIEPAGNLRGSERALLDLLDGACGLSVAVCCPPARPLNAELEARGIRVFPYYVYELHRKSKWQRLLAALGTLRACLEFKPDVIYLNQSGAYGVALMAATLLKVPIVAHVRLFEDVAYLARHRPNRRRLRGLIAVSIAVLEEIQRFRELATIPSHRVYDGYARTSGPHADLAPRNSSPRLACLGRLEPDKGTDILIAALARLQSNRETVACVFAGEGDRGFVQELKRMAVDTGTSSGIQWLGWVPDTVRVLSTCTVLACPSHRETFGRVILEAWDAGAVPVVFSGSGGAAEIVRAAGGGFLYFEQTPDALAMALRDALELAPEHAAGLVSNGRAWMATNCDQKQSSDAVIAILENACANSRS